MAVLNLIPGENTDLDLHVNLCQQRYTELSAKVDRVDARTEQLHITLTELRDLILESKAQGLSVLNRWIILGLSSITTILLSVNGWLVIHYLKTFT